MPCTLGQSLCFDSLLAVNVSIWIQIWFCSVVVHAVGRGKGVVVRGGRVRYRRGEVGVGGAGDWLFAVA